MSESADHIRTGKSWEEFCDTLKAAGQVILSPDAPDDLLNRAEGFRYLSRLTRAGLEAFIEYADPEAPELHRPIHETAKIGADNPDNYYMRAAVSSAHEYRIVGKRGSVAYLGFGAQSPGVASTGDSSQAGYVEAADLECARELHVDVAAVAVGGGEGLHPSAILEHELAIQFVGQPSRERGLTYTDGSFNRYVA